MTLTFDAERHQYYVDDKPIPSVTQIVAPLGTGYDAPDEVSYRENLDGENGWWTCSTPVCPECGSEEIEEREDEEDDEE